jgi:hypothetical protein
MIWLDTHDKGAMCGTDAVGRGPYVLFVCQTILAFSYMFFVFECQYDLERCKKAFINHRTLLDWQVRDTIWIPLPSKLTRLSLRNVHFILQTASSTHIVEQVRFK